MPISFSKITPDTAKSIDVVFCDIDDTISSDGKILPEAYEALWKLFRNGINVVPITGRCAGWVDHIARMWPVRGVVGENGAFYFYMNTDKKPHKLVKRYYLDKNDITENKRRFELIKEEIFRKFPDAKEASDQPYREFDLAIDFCEDVPAHSREEILEMTEIFHKYGAQTKISSIHINGWFGDYDKLTMTKIFAKEQLGMNLDDKNDRIRALFIGDSPNDQPMFDFFPVSVGVRNVEKFLDLIQKPPTYITERVAGLGFAEMVDKLLELH